MTQPPGAQQSATPLARSRYRIRPDLADSHRLAWQHIAAPGTWLNAERRLAVAAEIRKARDCSFCDEIKAALSPNIKGSHQSAGELGAAQVELIHRVVADPGRLSEKWAQSVLAMGLSEGEYVEIVGIIAMVMMMDTFTRALGLPERALPAATAGEPSRYRPPGAKKKACWLSIVEPADTVESDGPMYPSPKPGYIYRALSLVPQAVREYWALGSAHYLPGQYVHQFDKSIRAITRTQTEILAARVSALHQCAY